MKKPNFFIVGAPKCGTTWLHHYLSQHPQVYMCNPKEPHFFNTDSKFRFFRSLDAYEALFAPAPADAIAVGEASVRYLLSHVAASNILEYQPDARFIAMVRNPVDMAPSLHKQVLFSSYESVENFDQAWHLQAERANGLQVPDHCLDGSLVQYRSTCLLGEQLDRLVRRAGRDRVHVIVYDDLRADPASVFASAIDFLDLQPWAPDTFQTVNAAKARRSPWLARRVKDLARLKEKLGLRASMGLLARLNRMNTSSPDRVSRPSAAVLDTMRRDFAPDVELLSRILHRPLDHWLDAPVAGTPRPVAL